MARDFEDAANDLIENMNDGMESIVDAIMAEANDQVPKETGVLARSAFISGKDSTQGFNLTFGFGFGDEVNPITHRLASDYAVPVHEIMEGVGGRSGTGAHHEPPTKAKFLEDPVLEFAPMVQKMLSVHMKEESISKWWSHKGPTAVAERRGLLPGEKVVGGSTLFGGGQPVRRGRYFVRKYVE